MSEDFGKDMLMLGGTVAGFIAAMLTVMEKVLDIQNRLTSKKDRSSPTSSDRPGSDSSPAIDLFSSKPFRGVSNLLLYETSVIVAAGLLLNYVGLTLSRHLESILFLDMTGTALVAFPLGPLVGSHCCPPFKFWRQLVVVSGNRSGCGDFSLVAGEYDRRLLLGLDGQTTGISKISPHGTQLRPVPCLVPLYLWCRRRDRHEPAGNLCPGSPP
jgi:hypothetical protein